MIFGSIIICIYILIVNGNKIDTVMHMNEHLTL